MGTLKAALDWAARGFPVFPLVENGKTPALGENWIDVATTDPAIIKSLWIEPITGMERNYNIGSSCDDYVVIDLDVKKGKDGINKYRAIGGTFDTLLVETPTAGLHCYFYGPESSNKAIQDGIDVRSFHGYVVAPGSRIDGRDYFIKADRDIIICPPTIEAYLTPVYRRQGDDDKTILLDSPSAVEAARRYLETTPVAVEGEQGDATTFKTAARLVREMALSPSMAYALMRDEWNDRCEPPWEHDDLLRKVNNAADYGTATLGTLTAEQLYGHLPRVAPPPSVFGSVGFGNALVPMDMRRRPWLIDRVLMTGAVTMLLASGASGKSTLGLVIAAHLALGLNFGPYKTEFRCRSIIYNGEDDIDEQSRRLLAVCIAYGFDYDVVKEMIMLLSPRILKMTLVRKEGYNPIRNDELIQQLKVQAQGSDVGLLIVDPLVKIHGCDESDNPQMDFVMETLVDIAHDANVAVMVLHHTSKGGPQDQRQGNMDISRGASAMVNAARIAFTLVNASQDDAEQYGFRDDERMEWVRLDDAKMNFTLASSTAVWFKKIGLRIISGDMVGVLHWEDRIRSTEVIKQRIGQIIVGQMILSNAGSLSLAAAVTAVKSNDGLMANKTDMDVRRKLEGWFAAEYHVAERFIQCVRDEKSTDKHKPVVFQMR